MGMRRVRVIVGSPGTESAWSASCSRRRLFSSSRHFAISILTRNGDHRSHLGEGVAECACRDLAAHVVAIVVIAVLVTPAVAQEWPSGTVRVVVPYAAGGPVDVPARLLIERLAAQTKGVFILENRPGAGGSIGLQAVVQAAPDGGTLLLTTSSVTMVPTIYPKLAFDPLRDLTSISLVTEVPISLAVRAASPFRDLADLIARAKAEPGKYTFGSGGVGTGNHLAGELLKKLAGIDLLHVPFRGVAPALTALYAGDIDMLFASTVETVSHARDRRIRVLGVGSPQPIPELPDSRPSATWCRAMSRPTGTACSGRAACRPAC